MRTPANIPHIIDMPLLAYLLTFSTYGTHLPGAENGWVDAQHCIPGSPLLESNPDLESHWRMRLNDPPWILDLKARALTLQAIRSVCAYRKWTTHAVHVRTNHVHAVISGEAKPERILADCKAYATRALRAQPEATPRRRYWAKHGSTRYLWDPANLNAAVEYVLNSQGSKMACYPQALTEPRPSGSPCPQPITPPPRQTGTSNRHPPTADSSSPRHY